MTTTFEFLDYKRMRALHDKCEKIKEILGSHVPEDYDYKDSIFCDKYEVNWMSRYATIPHPTSAHEISINEDVSLDVVSDCLITSYQELALITYDHNCLHGSKTTTKLTTFSPEVVSSLITAKCLYRFKVEYAEYAYTTLPEYSYFKTVLESCRKLCKVFTEHSDVNILNMQLVASAQFIEELDINDITEHLVPIDKEELKEVLEFKMEELIAETKQKEADKITEKVNELEKDYYKELAKLNTKGDNNLSKQEPRKGFFERLFS